MGARDEEFEGAGDDFEFDGEAGEGFAVDLGVEGIGVEGFADDGFGFPEVDAFGFAQIAEQEAGQIAEIAEATLGGQGHQFELVLKKIGAGGDFEGAAVVLRAADDDEGGVEFLVAGDDSEVREFVTENFAGALPPVGENANARFEIEIDGVDDHAVGAGSGYAEEIFFLFGLLEGGGQAEGNFFHGSVNEFLGGAGDVPGQVQFFGEDVRGATWKERERDTVAVLLGGEAVDDFVERAVTATGNDELATFVGGA